MRQRAQDRQRRDQQLPAALDQLATALRSGASLTQALGETGTALEAPLGPEVLAVARAAERGRPLRDVLDDWSASHPDTGTRLASTALVLATLVGATPARAVDGVAATLRERLDLAAERRTLAVQARTSALVLSVAPVGFAVVLVVADTAAAGFLLGTPAGWACLTVGVGPRRRGGVVDDPPQPERRLVSPATLLLAAAWSVVAGMVAAAALQRRARREPVGTGRPRLAAVASTARPSLDLRPATPVETLGAAVRRLARSGDPDRQPPLRAAAAGAVGLPAGRAPGHGRPTELGPRNGRSVGCSAGHRAQRGGCVGGRPGDRSARRAGDRPGSRPPSGVVGPGRPRAAGRGARAWPPSR